MKKAILLLQLFLFSSILNAQNFKLPTPNSEGFTDMVVYDREGNLYHLDDLKFPMPASGGGPSIMTIPPTCIAGIFRLHFADSGTGQGFDDPTDGPARQAVACQVFTDLSQLINEAGSPYTSIANLGAGTSYVEINVQTSLNSPANPTLGTAGQFFLTTTPGIVHGSVWQTINTGIDAWFGVNASNLGVMGIFHGQMQINFGHPFYSGTNPLLIPPGDFDLYSVILHEGIHALGFGSLIDQNGNSKLTSSNPGIFSIYDTYLEDVATSNRLVNWNGCYVAGTSISPLSILTTSCTITFDGTNSTFVSSDPPWSNGTSLSHYPIGSCGNPGNYSMNPSAAPGITRRFPDIAEVTTLCDIGYSTSGAYPGAAYPPSGICGTRIAGTNDYATYTVSAPGTNYSTPNNTPFVFSSTDILGNDENATFYDCLEVANGSGTLTGALSGGTGINITFTPNTGFAGVAILRYIPRINSTGTRGNITYVFITVMPPPLPPCAPATCEMVCYGGFEEFTSQLQYDLYTLGGNSTGNSFSYNAVTFPDNSPDLFTTGMGFGSNVSCGTASGPITAFAGTQFVALVLRNDFVTSVNSPEGPAFPLNGSILPGETVTVTMWSRLAHPSCMGGIEVRFTNMAPCIGPTYPPLATCPGLVQSVPIASGALVNNSLWQPLNFVYTNTTGVTLTHLLINSLPYAMYNSFPLGFLFIDNVSCIKDTPNLTVTKTGPANACPGEVITYNIDICNTSAFPAPSVQITDILSTGLSLSAGGSFTYPTQTLPVLPSGGCQNYTLNALVTASLGSVTNTANVSSGGCLSNATTNSVVTSINPPTLNITQTVSNTSPASGSTIILTVDICNYTNAPVTGINVETSVPAGNVITAGPGYTVSPGLITFTTFNLPAGTITSPACSTFVIPITVNCPGGSGNICTTILTGGSVCANQNNCTSITVTGSATVVAEPNLTVCNGAFVPANTFASLPAGATFTWTTSTAIGLPASGTGGTPPFAAVNTSGSPIVCTVTITPTLAGCPGPSSTYMITVNPSPTVVAEPNITVCAGAVILVNNFASTPAGATFTWTNSNTAIGLAASGSGSVPAFTATNTTTSPITATITILPTLAGCPGPFSSYTITVNPIPVVTVTPSSATILSGGNVTLVASGASTYSWTPVTGLSCTSCATTIASPTTTTTYVVTGTNSFGCISTASVTVTVVPACSPTPNFLAATYSTNTTLTAAGLWSPTAFNTTVIGGATLTLNNIDLVMPAGSMITVTPGCTLKVISGTQIWACTDNMWQGIRVQAGGRIEMSGGSAIEDAEHAVHIMNSITTEAQFQIIGSLFNKNFKGVVVDPYPLVHNGQLHGSTFRSVASVNVPNSSLAPLSTLKIPHVTVPARKANMGVEITNVAQINIGSTGAGNLFSGIEVGIHSTQNTKLFSIKNIFRTIAYGSCGTFCVVANTGIGIWADKSGSIIVGGSPASANTFNTCANGIITNQNVNVDAQQNTFQTIAAGLLFPCRAIGIYNESGNIINIRNNTFRDFRDGVLIHTYNQTSAVVADNDFKKFPKGVGIYSLQNTNSNLTAQNNQFNNTAVDFGMTAIRVQNAVIISNGIVNIYGNVVRNCISGILTTNIQRPDISLLNDVKFNFSSPPTSVHYGIRLMNCPNSIVNDNLVWKQGGVTAGSSYNNLLYAYSFDVGCMGSTVTNNRSIRMNDGYRFAGSTNNPLTFGCNFSNFDYFGLELNTTAIGNQGVAGISAQDNQWTLVSNTTYPGRYGIISSSSPTPVFYTRLMGLPFAVATFDQNPSTSVTFTSTLAPNYYCTYGCANPPCYHQVVKKIAKKEDPYDALSDNATSITFTHAYAEVMRDSTIYQQGTPDDVVIVNFKDSLAMTNFGTLYDVSKMFEEGDTTGARIANAAIVPKDCKEQSHKIVNEIYGRTWAKGIFEFSSSDESALQTIADYYVEDCGIAVYDARVMLRYDKDDFPNMSHSMLTMHESNQDSYGLMYPNPANTVAYYEAELLENESGFVQLYDLLGNLVATQKLAPSVNKAEFDLNKLANGIYIYKVIINNELKSSNKLVITK